MVCIKDDTAFFAHVNIAFTRFDQQVSPACGVLSKWIKPVASIKLFIVAEFLKALFLPSLYHHHTLQSSRWQKCTFYVDWPNIIKISKECKEGKQNYISAIYKDVLDALDGVQASSGGYHNFTVRMTLFSMQK